eukprot:1394467-Amorphochlora_amoeboformis.AAC.1
MAHYQYEAVAVHMVGITAISSSPDPRAFSCTITNLWNSLPFNCPCQEIELWLGKFIAAVDYHFEDIFVCVLALGRKAKLLDAIYTLPDSVKNHHQTNRKPSPGNPTDVRGGMCTWLLT